MLKATIRISKQLPHTTVKWVLSLLVKGGLSALFTPLIWFIAKQSCKSSPDGNYSLLQEPDFNRSSIGEEKVLFIVHIHFPEFVERFIKGAAQLRQTNWKFVVTSSNLQILEKVNTLQESEGLQEVYTMRVPNRGRNISPFIQALKEHGQDHEVVIHVHSKRSEHSKSKNVESWVNSQWNLLFDNPDLVRRIVALFIEYPRVSIAYPAVQSVLSPWTYTWSSNARRARKLLMPLGITVNSLERIAFPAGAMFAARIKDLLFLKKLKLHPEDFPEEAGQLDGELQHVVERLFGFVPEKTGGLHAIYLPSSDAFTTETKAVTENSEWLALPTRAGKN
jgi:lipopolysaccharide biosynthesis protein